MSLRARDWAWQQTCQTPTEKLILLAIAERADKTGFAFPGIDRLAAAAGVNRRNTQKHLRALADPARAGGALISIEERARVNGSSRSNGYQLMLERVETSVDNPVTVGGEGVAGVTRGVSRATSLYEPSDEPEQLTLSSFHSESGRSLIGKKFGSVEKQNDHIRWLLHLQRQHGRLAKATGPEASADASVLRSLVQRGCNVAELAAAIEGVRYAADRGELAGFIERGAPFGAAALKTERNGRPLWRWAADRWRKHLEEPRMVGDVLRSIMSRPASREPGRSASGSVRSSRREPRGP